MSDVLNNDFIELLLIEDLEEDAQLTLRALRKNNLVNRIKWIEDGEDALNYLFAKDNYVDRDSHDTPKVILLDLKLPKINGLEVLKQIKSNEITKRIPVIVMTSSKESKDIDLAYSLGANSYIVKPIDFKKFAEVASSLGVYWLMINQNPSL